MAAPAQREMAPADERAWLARALLVLIDPRPVFAALRDDSEDAARARQEPILALVGLAGIASILWTSVAGRVMDDPAYDGLVVAVWALALLVVGTRTLHAWTWPRTLEGVGLAVVIPALVAVAVHVL